MKQIVTGASSSDTLISPDGLYKTTVDAIVKANNLDPNKYLTVGQKLVISGGSVTPAPQPVVYTVKAGDTLWKISQQYGTNVVGQKIKVSN